MTAKMSDVMAMAGETLARSALGHLHRVGVLFLAVIGQERARASASCVSSSSPSLGRNALVHLHRMHCAPTRSCLNGQLGDGTTTPRRRTVKLDFSARALAIAAGGCHWEIQDGQTARRVWVLIYETPNKKTVYNIPWETVQFQRINVIDARHGWHCLHGTVTAHGQIM